jgi:hypothetical protein
MDFDQRLEKAINRGFRKKDAAEQELERQRLTEEECRSLHSRARMELSAHVNTGLSKLVDHFPGFDFQEVVSADGWGGKVARDDLAGAPGKPMSRLYSHLEVLVKPMSSARIVELGVRGAIRNKETLSRSHYQRLDELDLETFKDVVDQWLLEYAEKFAMSS